MKFCEKCGNLLYVEKKRKAAYLVCRNCHKTTKLKGEKLTISEVSHDNRKKVVLLGKEEQYAELPKIKIMCPRCEHMEAFWWMQQTRSADEPPTLFYKCVKCGYSWRSYG